MLLCDVFHSLIADSRASKEGHAQQSVIAAELGIPLLGSKTHRSELLKKIPLLPELESCLKGASALLTSRKKLPTSRIRELQEELKVSSKANFFLGVHIHTILVLAPPHRRCAKQL